MSDFHRSSFKMARGYVYAKLQMNLLKRKIVIQV